MPDSTLCASICEVSKKCKRHPDSGTQPSQWQYWALFGTEGEQCQLFIEKGKTNAY